MILVWKDNKSFGRHLENMRCFREGHEAEAKCGREMIMDMPALGGNQIPAETGGSRSRLEAAGPAVVPLWKFTLSAGVKN